MDPPQDIQQPIPTSDPVPTEQVAPRVEVEVPQVAVDVSKIEVEVPKVVDQDKPATDNKMEEEKAPENLPIQYDSVLIDQQAETIRKEIEENSPLISDVLPLDMLEFEFLEHAAYLIKTKNLKTKYSDYRKVRRDGSCFYRAYLFGIFEHIMKAKDKALLTRITKLIKDSKNYLLSANFEEFVIEEFQQTLLDALELMEKDLMNENILIDMFCDKMRSDSLVMYLRFLTSGYLKTNAFLFEHFLENGIPMDFFCQTEVEPIDKECDQIQIMALVNYLEVPLRIVYLDANPKKTEAEEMIFPESADPKTLFCTLLYRPGHYDLLYKQ
jgi:ubiquitin thioesterase protein OTUB1